MSFATLQPLGAQVPTTLSYQGRLLTNDATQGPAAGTVDIDFSIWTGPASDGAATQVWFEGWVDVELSNGVFSVLLGSNGSPLVPADFAVDTSLYLQLVIDGETLVPRQRLGSTPFAFVDQPANELQDLSLVGSTLSLTGDASTVDLSGFVDTDDQDLSLSGDTLSLTGDATSVDLSVFRDNTDAQSLSLNGDELSLSGGAGAVDLAAADAVAQLLRLASAIDAGRTVFVAREATSSDLGGLAGADAFCQTRAAAAGLPGTYMAWLSDSTGSPSTRFSRFGSFRLVDGTPIAEDWDDLTDGTLLNAIELDEGGSPAPGPPFMWSNTAVDGTLRGDDHCADWTSADGSLGGAVGVRSATDGSWTALPGGPTPCGFPTQIYCFQQSLTVADDQRLRLVGDRLELTADGGTITVDLASFLDNTDNQELSISGDELRLTSDDGVDTVDLSAYRDTSDRQDLTLTGDTLSLTGDPTAVDLQVYRDNTDAQSLSFVGDTLTVSGSDSSVDLGVYMTRAEVFALLEDVGGARRIFVSSQRYQGNLGGLDGADDACQDLAEAAGLEGFFQAWLSTSVEDMDSRILRRDRAFVRVDGVTVANDYGDLTDGSLDAAIDVTEQGDTVGGGTDGTVWTGTDPQGFRVAPNCGNWTLTASLGRAGRANQTSGAWTDASLAPACNNFRRLYCLERDLL